MKISIGQRKLPSGKLSLYLDFRVNGKRHKEYLKLFLSGKKRKTQEDKSTLELAEKIRAEKEHDVNTGKYNFVSKEKSNADFVEYFRFQTQKEIDDYESGVTKSKTYATYKSTLKHLVAFTKGSCTFSYVTVEWLEDVRAYLLKVVDSPRTSSTYFSKIRAVINKAYRERIINFNPVKSVPQISKGQSEKVFLLEEELKRLVQAPCKKAPLKQAFLFSCFTGLRLSDVENLTWSKIQGERLHFRQQKTDGFEYIPLSKTALDILQTTLEEGEVPEPEKKVFNLIGRSHFKYYFNLWVKAAGIDKKVTYHSSRHTFATLLLTKGVDLYTVSKLLGHQDIQTTIIYAKIIDKVKDNAIDSLPVLEVK